MPVSEHSASRGLALVFAGAWLSLMLSSRCETLSGSVARDPFDCSLGSCVTQS